MVNCQLTKPILVNQLLRTLNSLSTLDSFNIVASFLILIKKLAPTYAGPSLYQDKTFNQQNKKTTVVVGFNQLISHYVLSYVFWVSVECRQSLMYFQLCFSERIFIMVLTLTFSKSSTLCR